MKFKIGDKIRIKTYEELEEENIGGDWDWPYQYSQGVSGVIKRVSKNSYYIKFNINEMFSINEVSEEEDKREIIKQNENTPYSEEEFVVLKNKILNLE